MPFGTIVLRRSTDKLYGRFGLVLVVPAIHVFTFWSDPDTLGRNIRKGWHRKIALLYHGYITTRCRKLSDRRIPISPPCETLEMFASADAAAECGIDAFEPRLTHASQGRKAHVGMEEVCKHRC